MLLSWSLLIRYNTVCLPHNKYRLFLTGNSSTYSLSFLVRGSCKKFCHWVPITSMLRFIKRFITEKVREKCRECHNHKPQPFPDIKRKRKTTNSNKHKSIKHTKSTKISSLFPKPCNRNAKRTAKHKNKMAQGKTYNKSPRRINHKAPKSKTNTWTTALEWTVE